MNLDFISSRPTIIPPRACHAASGFGYLFIGSAIIKNPRRLDTDALGHDKFLAVCQPLSPYPEIRTTIDIRICFSGIRN